MLNKPRGAVTTASDEKGRQTVYAFLDSALPWVAPVGRLDKASEGLLLLTNDSEWAAQVQAPASHLHKTYHVQIDRSRRHNIAGINPQGSQNGKRASSCGSRAFASCVAASVIPGSK